MRSEIILVLALQGIAFCITDTSIVNPIIGKYTPTKSPGVILTEGAEFLKSAIVFRNECSVFQIEKTKTNIIDGIPYINDFLTSARLFVSISISINLSGW